MLAEESSEATKVMSRVDLAIRSWRVGHVAIGAVLDAGV